MGWQFGKGGRVVRREGGMELCCIAPGKQNVSRDSQQEFHHSYIIFWIIVGEHIPFALERSGIVSQEGSLKICFSIVLMVLMKG